MAAGKQHHNRNHVVDGHGRGEEQDGDRHGGGIVVAGIDHNGKGDKGEVAAVAGLDERGGGGAGEAKQGGGRIADRHAERGGDEHGGPDVAVVGEIDIGGGDFKEEKRGEADPVGEAVHAGNEGRGEETAGAQGGAERNDEKDGGERLEDLHGAARSRARIAGLYGGRAEGAMQSGITKSGPCRFDRARH